MHALLKPVTYLPILLIVGDVGDSGDVGVACGGAGGGLSGTSNTRSLTAPLNLILAWLCLAVGVQVKMTRNLGG